jgi:prephenate dehydrogenase
MSHGVTDAVTLDPMQVLPTADVVWLCMNPGGIVDYMARYAGVFKPGALVTDVGGIKTAIMQGAKVLPESVDFIGCHPMAGTEFSGIEHSFPTMFQRAHFILTPGERATGEHIALMRRFAAYMGCADVVMTTPERHDEIIAYTSQLMHIMAVAVCDDEDLFQCRGFEGGSFRDCTRVAALDVPLWTQLFSMNAPALSKVIARLEHSLHAYRLAVESGDTGVLAEKLAFSAQRKRQMNLPGPGQVML